MPEREEEFHMGKQMEIGSRNGAVKESALKRGDIYYADLGKAGSSRGSEQRGRRPVLVIQNDIGNRYAPTTIVAVLTTKWKRNLPTHVRLNEFSGLHRASTICLEQIRTIDKKRLEDYRGNIGVEAMKAVENALSISLGADGLLHYRENLAKIETE